MRNICLIVMVMIACIIGCSCASNNGNIETEDLNSSQRPELTEESTNLQQTPEVIEMMAEWADYSSYDEYVNSFDNIVIAKVIDILPGISMTRKELGISDNESERIFTSYNIQVIETLKGNFKSGDSIKLEQDGGTVGNKTIVIKDAPFLKKDSTYLIYIYEPEGRNEGEYFNYMVSDPLDGYVEIVKGELVPHKYSRFYAQGMTIDEASTMIKGKSETTGQ